jgi:hypothetical protein
MPYSSRSARRRGAATATDLSYVYAAAREIAEALEGFTVIVTVDRAGRNRR